MGSLRWLLSVLALLAMTLTCPGWPGPVPKEEPVPNELPRSWSLEEIAKATPPLATKGRVYVLAWSVLQDDRPLRVENCLALRVLDKDDGHGRWCLAHLVRHPADDKPEWRVSFSHILGARGTKSLTGTWVFHDKRFKKKPGNKEIYTSFSAEEVDWSFDQTKGYRFVGCAVCEKSWLAAIGEKPTQFFGR
jgi:hypothetical protein